MIVYLFILSPRNPRAQRMETAEQTEAFPFLFLTKSHSADNLFRIMADVCEASVSSVHSVDSSRTFVFIRVHSWFLISRSGSVQKKAVGTNVPTA